MLIVHYHIISISPVSILSDTADALGRKGRSLIEMANNSSVDHAIKYRQCSFVASIEKFAYSLMHQHVIGYIHQWVDFVSIIRPLLLHNDESTGQKEFIYYECEILCGSSPEKRVTSLRFGFSSSGNNSGNTDHALLYEILWKAD
jgi:hypothetical protein